jgi:polyisoprenoid-binding protein YceI
MKIRLLLCVLILAMPPLTRAETYKIDPDRSRIAFSVHQFLGTVSGEFRKFDGTIEIDPKQPERSSVNVSIDVGSIDTRNRQRDEHLSGSAFLDSARFPAITFRSRSVKQTGPDSGDITGDLTLHGQTRRFTLHVRLATSISAGVPALTKWIVTSDPIRRQDFGVMFSGATEAISGIDQEVVTRIEIGASRVE